MKKYFYLLLTVLATFACSNTDTSESDGYKNVTAEEAMNLIQEGVQILDVRTAEEVSHGKIEGAINIDFFADDFKEQLSRLDKAKPLLVYCKSGSRSSKSSMILVKQGFSPVYNLLGGFSNWSK